MQRFAKHLATIVIALAAAPVCAAELLAGPYIAAGIGQKSPTMSNTVADGAGNTAQVSFGDTSLFGQLAAGYVFPLGGPVRLGLGAFYDLGSAKAGAAIITIGGAGAAVEFRQTRRYGLSIEPGIALGESALAYLSLAYNRARGEAIANGASGSETFTGFGHGLGLRHAVNPSVFLYAEWQAVDYGTKITAAGGFTQTVKPKTTTGLAGVGYRF